MTKDMKDVPPPLPPPPKNLTLGERIARVSRLYPDAMKDIDSASPEVLRAIILELGWMPNPNAGLSALGRFVQPASAANLLSFFKELSQDVGSFVRECCDLVEPEFDDDGRPKVWVDLEQLFASYKQWCADQGISKVPPITAFCRKLRAACPKVEDRQYRAAGKVRRRYVGIKLKVEISQLL